MEFIGILFVVMLICYMIGAETIITILVIVGIAALVGNLLLQKWSKNKEKEDKRKEDILQARCFNTDSHYSQKYDNRPIVTGDYFRYTWETQSELSNYCYCEYANSATCANCARRKEHIKDGAYYYGVSSKCEEYKP